MAHLTMKYRDLLKLLRDDGWQHIRTTGSHLHFKHPIKPGLVTRTFRRKARSRCRTRNFAFHSQTGGTKMSTMEYTVIIEPADDGTFSVYVPDLPGCVSTGATRQDAIESIREAIQGHIQTLRELGDPVPPPRSQSQTVAA
jgi:predicted RNase H-like HicB family nuclease/predicted RNA binding protein YcfA (HicA-like mRNA interferase family)